MASKPWQSKHILAVNRRVYWIQIRSLLSQPQKIYKSLSLLCNILIKDQNSLQCKTKRPEIQMTRELTEDFAGHSKLWSRHFQQNLSHMDHIPWETDVDIPAHQSETIGRSIAAFQLGENSEDGTFRRSGQGYADETGDHEYLNTLDMFIKEENRHSDVLGRFMDRQSIPKIEQEWTDSTFRFIRKIAGLNVCISVLLTAEIIASVYYRALGRATDSPVLLAICEQILTDESHHLVFQASTLTKQRRNWSRFRCWTFKQLQRILMAGTICVVWYEHGAVYRAGGYSFSKMASETWTSLENVLRIITHGIEGQLPTPSDTILPKENWLTMPLGE